jgi:hypothetical protein
MLLRRLESRVNSLVGLSGSFFAARKTVCQDLSPHMQSDFRTLLNSIKLGLRGISDPGVTGSYLDVSDPNREFERKVRTVLRGLTVFFRHVEYLNISRYGFFSFQFFCHKLLRWLVPFFMVIAFMANSVLAAGSKSYLYVLLVHGMFYSLAFWGYAKKDHANRFMKIPYYFASVNYSIMVAWWKYLNNQRVVMWNPSDR